MYKKTLRILLMMGGRFDNAVAEYAVRLGHMLSERGHSVLFLGSPDSPVVRRALNTSVEKVECIRVNSPNPVKFFYQVRKYRRIVREFKPDLINTYKSSDHTFAVLVSPRCRPPIVRTRCEPKMPGATFVNRALYKKASTYITCAEFIRDQHLSRLGVNPKSVNLIRPYIDVDSFRLDAPDQTTARKALGLKDTVWFGVIARFTEVKAHKVALRAFAEVIHNQIPEARLLFSGVEYDVSIEDLKRCAQDLLIGDKVHFIPGKVSDVRTALSALDVLLVPSAASESIARIAMEALSLGIPTVGSSMNSIPEVIGDAGLVVLPNDSKALGEAAVRMFRDKEISVRARELGPERMRRCYNPEQFIALTEEVFYRSVTLG